MLIQRTERDIYKNYNSGTGIYNSQNPTKKVRKIKQKELKYFFKSINNNNNRNKIISITQKLKAMFTFCETEAYL